MTVDLDADAHWLDTCTYCPKLCTQSCPVSAALPRESLIPQQKMQTANLLRRGHLPWNADYTEVLYGCSGCGACTAVCAWENQPGRILIAARGAAEQRRAGHPQLLRLPERHRARSERLAATLRKAVPAQRRSDDARVALHAGCDTLESAPEDLHAALSFFDQVADYVRVLDTDEPCGGYPLWAAGQLEALRHHARRFAAGVAKSARVISTCPACVWLVREVYPREGISVRTEFLHVLELAQSFVQRVPETTGEARQPALYHDPCYLGRLRGIYDAPRRLLARVAEPREFSRNRAEAECSGGGGLVPKTMPDTALDMARRRLRQAHETGVRRVVTACPTCKKQLSRAADGLEVVDLLTLVARSFEQPG
jgi:Fe-S oxidoreductase